ncbi:ParB/RepB/Spo0J family partition protein [Rhizohabitans arisaemae]|uniref:ParB/RepB/Spo0J family partition protein n=1 Tax=Rhizohabitans arisaemae TaxID=2720610 RepID=UPI0024B1464A|nr:streptomycin biosynthesis regulator [Rhizohabitans arisaemae]
MLHPGDSPRLSGEDEAHIRRLAETDATLPPILVHKPTLKVIDGMHRLRAAILRGHRSIEVEFFDGCEEDAFILAVKANIAHGMPLSLADRRAAALRILCSQPHMSDRAIAEAAGLSAKTVAGLRRHSTEEDPQSNSRLGKDGRRRPLSAVDGRRRAADVIAARPGATLREIAKDAEVSLGTAHDVRERMRRGEDPVALKGRGGAHVGDGVNRPVNGLGTDGCGEDGSDPAVLGLEAAALAEARRNEDRKALARLRSLQKDPSLRFTDAGRELLRWLHVQGHAEDRRSDMIEAVPPHLTLIVADLAMYCAETWRDFAKELQERGRDLAR